MNYSNHAEEVTEQMGAALAEYSRETRSVLLRVNGVGAVFATWLTVVSGQLVAGGPFFALGLALSLAWSGSLYAVGWYLRRRATRRRPIDVLIDRYRAVGAGLSIGACLCGIAGTAGVANAIVGGYT